MPKRCSIGCWIVGFDCVVSGRFAYNKLMNTAKALFDGKVIHLPSQMNDAEPGEVTIIYQSKQKSGKSIWDLIGSNPNPKSGAELDARLKEERDSWDN